MAPSRVVQAQTPEQVAATLEAFFAEWPSSVVLEDGEVLFDMREAKFSVSDEHGRCSLHLWGPERNLVRRALAANVRGKTLRVDVLKFGQLKPTMLEVAGDRDRRTLSTREGTRQRYVKILERALSRQSPEWTPHGFRTAMDLEKSFGPAYARGLLVRGTLAWAVIGVNDEETPATVDGVLIFGILWLESCRATSRNKTLQGLKLVLPRGMAALTLSRMLWLSGARSQWELWELEQREEELIVRDIADQGNISTRLVQAPQLDRAQERFAAASERVFALVPEAARGTVEQRVRSSTELAFLLHGLEFARVRARASSGSFLREEEITFGAGARETPLLPENEEALRDLVARLFERRQPSGDRRDPLFRLQPERWLEGTLRRDLTAVDPRLRPAPVYAQVPAFAGGDRGMLDLLAVSEDGRLSVIEVKGDDDLQLALQGLDYWIRVRWHHAQHAEQRTGLGEFQRHGYFGGLFLSDADPRLFLVAPALRIHPATEIILRHLSARVEWTLVAVGEQWRSGLKVIWRKRSHDRG